MTGRVVKGKEKSPPKTPTKRKPARGNEIRVTPASHISNYVAGWSASLIV